MNSNNQTLDTLVGFNNFNKTLTHCISSGLAKLILHISGEIDVETCGGYLLRTKKIQSVRELANEVGMGYSTVRRHIKVADAAGIFTMVSSRNSIVFEFVGFQNYLSTKMQDHRCVDKSEGAGDASSQLQITRNDSVDGVSDVVDNNLRQQKKEVDVADSGLRQQKKAPDVADSDHVGIDLDFSGPIELSRMGATIRKIAPKKNGKLEEISTLWTSFKKYNLGKGYRFVPVSWLVGFCQQYEKNQQLFVGCSNSSGDTPDFELYGAHFQAIERPISSAPKPLHYSN